MDILINLLKEIAVFYNEVAIYLVIGFFVAALLHIFFPESIIRRHLGSNSITSVIKSTLFGIPLPICSCGVVPVAASLNNSGASKGATVSFLIATPQIGADSFMITYSLLGWIFGFFRIAASFVSALFAGIIINLADRTKSNPQSMTISQEEEESFRDRAKYIVHYVEYDLLGSIADALVIGLIIAGLITVFIPDNFFEIYLGDEFLSMILMLVIGIPMYVCASASTPIAASLILKGMSPGAALVFLLTGPATNAINISAVTNIVGKKFTMTYLAVIAVASLLLGYALNFFVGIFGIQNVIIMHHHDQIPQWLKLAGSAGLTFMLAWYYFSTKVFSKRHHKEETLNTVSLNVSGMNCMHCSTSVKKAVESVNGTSNIRVNLENRNVAFDIIDNNLTEEVKSAIRFAGFAVE